MLCNLRPVIENCASRDFTTMSAKDTPCPCNRKGVFHRLRSSTAIKCICGRWFIVHPIRYTIKQEEPPKVSFFYLKLTSISNNRNQCTIAKKRYRFAFG